MGSFSQHSWVASQHALHSLAIASQRHHYTRLVHLYTRNKLIGNTFRTSTLRESAPKQPNALFNEEHTVPGGHISSTRSCARYNEGKGPCSQKAMEEQRKYPTWHKERRAEAVPTLRRPHIPLGHNLSHTPLMPLVPAATRCHHWQRCIKD